MYYCYFRDALEKKPLNWWNFLWTSLLSVGTFLCPVIIMLHNQQSENITWTWTNSACSGGLPGGPRLTLQSSSHGFPIWQYRRILREFTFPQKKGIVNVRTGMFVKEKFGEGSDKINGNNLQYIQTKMLFFSFCCIIIAKPSSPWHVVTAHLPIYSIPNEPVTQPRTGPGSPLARHSSRSLKC